MDRQKLFLVPRRIAVILGTNNSSKRFIAFSSVATIFSIIIGIPLLLTFPDADIVWIFIFECLVAPLAWWISGKIK